MPPSAEVVILSALVALAGCAIVRVVVWLVAEARAGRRSPVKRKPKMQPFTPQTVLDRSRHRSAASAMSNGAALSRKEDAARMDRREKRLAEIEEELPWARAGVLLYRLQKGLLSGYSARMFFVQGDAVSFLIYGPKNRKTVRTFSEEDLRAVDPRTLAIELIRQVENDK